MSTARGEYVKLKTDWMGNKAGAIISLPPKIAQDLFRRDAAEIFPKQSEEEVREKMGKLIKNKMIRRSIDK